MVAPKCMILQLWRIPSLIGPLIRIQNARKPHLSCCLGSSKECDSPASQSSDILSNVTLKGKGGGNIFCLLQVLVYQRLSRKCEEGGRSNENLKVQYYNSLKVQNKEYI
jgi:hypothetical protein